MRSRGALLALAVLLLAGVSYSATDPVIPRGIDAFTTTSDGTTFYDFAKTPIPAGFFCKGSPAFSGRVTLRGLPLETGVPGQLRNRDTVIERLDNAVFDENGVAVTRIRFQALSMVSIAPIRTGCGAYHVFVTLAGPQPVTRMKILRTEEGGGTFSAPLSINARLAFIPVKAPKGTNPRKLEMTGDVTFPAHPIPWSFTGGPQAKRIGTAFIDTNGDLTPDTRVFGTANFWPGWSPKGNVTKGCTYCDGEPVCHMEDGEQHCTGGGLRVCYPEQCP